MFLGIRHGERADASEDLSERQRIELSFDPHLTKLGEIQAQITGKEILKKLEDWEFRLKEKNLFVGKIQPIILCSPFLRTIQTAYNISQVLGSIYQDSIFVHDEIIELLDDDKKYGFEQDPRPRLFSNTRKIEDFKNYGIDFVNGKFKLRKSEFENEMYKVPVYPEPLVECQARVQKFMKYFPQQFFKKFKYNEFALIWVTHQYCLASACWFLKSSTIEEFPLENVGYCGILDCRFTDSNTEKPEILQLGSNDHLTLN